ncbi:MAG: hypothetical protein ABIP78_02155 [Pyrinomonadaceae bacterium]
MKTIFRYTNTAFLTAALIALGAVAALAQDPCTDADGITALGDKFRAQYALKGLDDRRMAIDSGKQFLEKYGACEATKELSDYLKLQLPRLDEKYKAAVKQQATDARYNRFNASVKASNFDETYASGKDILANEPEQLDVVISLGSIGYDESYKANYKYNEETLKFAKMAIASLEAGKVPKTYGLFQWSYKSKDNALGWLNYTIGYIYQVAQKDKKEALPYLYKATQAASETNKNPIPYELIGGYYFDELNKITQEIKVMADDQKTTDTEEVAKAKVEAIKAKVALANGTSERAIDAFSRAYSLASPTPAAKPYKDKMYKNLQDGYKLRFGKLDGLDAWIATTVKKPLPNPLTPVTPIFDPEPVTATTTVPVTTPATTPPSTVKPAPTTTIKPAPAPATKPVTPAPAKPVKPQATVKKRVVKKKVV